jgi:hypothetical protein
MRKYKMSWWISVVNENGETIDTDELRCEGGTPTLGGITEATLNVTYNYSKHFSFQLLDGVFALDAVSILKQVIARLKDDEDNDYWKATEGNVKRAVKTLLSFAEYAIKKNIVNARFQVH